MTVPDPVDAPAVLADAVEPAAQPGAAGGRGPMIWAGACTLALACISLYAWLR